MTRAEAIVRDGVTVGTVEPAPYGRAWIATTPDGTATRFASRALAVTALRMAAGQRA